MIRMMTYDECVRSLDIIYQSALNLSMSSYPSYADGTKTYEDFEQSLLRSFDRENEFVLVYEKNGKDCCWIHFMLEEDSKYCGLLSLQGQSNIGECTQEFLDYLKDKHPGYHCYFGFSSLNTEAVDTLSGNGFVIVDSCYHGILNLTKSHTYLIDSNINEITHQNYSIFKNIHDKVSGNMYWNSNKILENISRWFISTYNETAMYSISTKNMIEIFGFDTTLKNDSMYEFEELLKSHINSGINKQKEFLVFFVDDAYISSLTRHGFTIFGEYKCLYKII